jgi:hypothetical protein
MIDEIGSRLEAEFRDETRMKPARDAADLVHAARRGAKRKRVVRAAGTAAAVVVLATGFGAAAWGALTAVPEPGETNEVPQFNPYPRISAAPPIKADPSAKPVADELPRIGSFEYDENPLLPPAPYASPLILERVTDGWNLVLYTAGDPYDDPRAVTALYLESPQHTWYFVAELKRPAVRILRWRAVGDEVMLQVGDGANAKAVALNYVTGEQFAVDAFALELEFREVTEDGRELWWYRPPNSTSQNNVAYMYDPETHTLKKSNPFGLSTFETGSIRGNLTPAPQNPPQTAAARKFGYVGWWDWVTYGHRRGAV